MNRPYIIMVLFLVSLIQITYAQKTKTDANIIGHVVCCGKHIPYATISVKGTTIGITTDESGHYHLINLPVGELTIVAQSLGYKPQEKTISINTEETKELKFELEQDVLGIEEVVISGSKEATKRKQSAVIVNLISAKLFSTTQSVTLSEGLNYCPGLRMENNCQNCGFSQIRMNGMEGPYSQILINSRPIFSGLAGVYGLELIPSNMIKRVEVIRGGGSALYGSNAIAGTINLILKDPTNNTYELGMNSSLTGIGTDSDKATADHSINFNASLISPDNKTGFSLYGFFRDREAFDANNDLYSEMASLKNTTIGTRLFHRIGTRSKLIGDFFNIKENRRGGDRFEYPEHEANIAESLKHNLTTGALTYEQYFRENDLFSIFASGQKVDRDSYYGAEQSLSDYGNTKDFSYSAGIQYNAKFEESTLIFGAENNASQLKDTKLGFFDVDENTHTDNVIIADQTTNTLGVYSQYEINWNKLQASVGVRFDNYSIKDLECNTDDKTGNVLSPRLTFKYDIMDYLQARVSYSQGYRAPQIFDEDLHIETSGSRKIIHINSPDLKQETSHSYMASFDFNKRFDELSIGLLIEGFYTQLNNPFANEYSEADEEGTIVYTRINAKGGANVQGVNIELKIIPTYNLSFKTGFTLQQSLYEEAQEFNETSFFRTPQDYGYFNFDWQATHNLGFSSTGNYTGKMLVPYFGLQIHDPNAGELRKVNSFFDLGLKLRYDIKLNGAKLRFFTGVKNVFNSYQNDFDNGINRDPGYIYGPMTPRSIYFGLKFGNFLQ